MEFTKRDLTFRRLRAGESLKDDCISFNAELYSFWLCSPFKISATKSAEIVKGCNDWENIPFSNRWRDSVSRSCEVKRNLICQGFINGFAGRTPCTRDDAIWFQFR